MPNWQPEWTDVAFDFVMADASIAICQHALGVVRDRHAMLAGPFEVATAMWEGSNREHFDAEWNCVERLADAVVIELRETVHLLTSAIETARFDQRNREARREEWHRQKFAEDEHARQKAISEEAERRK